MSQPTKDLGDPLTTSHHAEEKPQVSKSPITTVAPGIPSSHQHRPLAARHRDIAKDRHSRHRPDTKVIRTPSPQRPRGRAPRKRAQLSGQALAMFPLPLFHSASMRHSPRFRYRQLSRPIKKDRRSRSTRNVSTTFNDLETRLVLPEFQANTYPASVPPDMDLDTILSYAYSTQGTQNGDYQCVAFSEELMTGYALANEEDYFANDGYECPGPTSLEPPAENGLGKEEEYMAMDNSDCEDEF